MQQTKLLILASMLNALNAVAEEKVEEDLFSYTLQELMTIKIVEVTAQKHLQPVNQVPIAISTITQDTINAFGAVHSTDLQWMTPGLTFTQSLSSSAVFLRGVGSSYSPAGGESPIAFYIDDVYLTSSSAPFFSLYNVELIEVIKGPQGTLFGRNATGGVIHVHTKAPSKETAVNARIKMGNYGHKELGLSVTGALSNNWQGIFSSQVSEQQGFGQNQVTGEPTFYNTTTAGQFKLLADYGETAVDLSLDYSHVIDMNGVGLVYAPGSVNKFTSSALYVGDYDTTGNIDNKNTNTQLALSMRLTSEFGWGEFKSISAIRYTGVEVIQDSDRTPLERAFKEVKTSADAITQEFQFLSSTEKKLQWIAGIYLMDERSKYHSPETKFTTSVVKLNETKANTQSAAVFGQVDYQISQSNNLTIGLRHTKDNRNVSDNQMIIDNNGNVTTLNDSVEGSWQQTTWRLALEHQFNNTMMGYISQNRGFKAGIFNVSPFNPQPVAPEVIDATELGLKSQLWKKRVTLNIAAFYYDYQDLQVQGNTTIDDFVFNILFNAASATITGFELDSEIIVTEKFRLRAGLTFIEGQYNAIYGVPYATEDPSGGNFIEPRDLTNLALYRTPDMSFNIAGVYQQNTAFGTIKLTSSLSYNSEYYFDAAHKSTQNELVMVNASLSWTDLSKHWQVELWGRNLLDELKYTNANSIVFGDVFSPEQPRTFGVSVSYRR